MTESHTKLERSHLETTLNAGPPENEKRDEGYALVNVMGREQYPQEHIPGSINIPSEQMGEFESRFDRGKKIVVYCASHDCPASNQVAKALAERGFRHVYEYEGGLSDWMEAGNPVEGAAG